VSECERFESMIRQHVAGDVDDTALPALQAHARACESCRQLLELHGELTGLRSRMPEPDELRLDRIQQSVLRELAVPRSAARSRWWLTAAAAAGLFVGGLVAGRLASGGAADRGEDGGEEPRLMAALTAEAAANRGLAAVDDSRFTYSNVTFRRVDGGRVALGFDVTTHLAVVEPERSALVREVLAQSLLDPSNVGARLKAMSLAAGALDPKLRDAIILALRHDDSLAVRLEALSILSRQIADGEVQSAVLATLRDDEAVQMRLLALECLAGQRVDHGRIREAIRGGEQRSGDEALMVRLSEYEKRPTGL